ncbi:hypothetical protein AMECASPLE_032417 [Ameca splendens]|uniref:Uncharacterized protein n=1 Tax=Ameca splendens TaxID=208324 RepID=A0ABV1A201_9TELE
MHWGSCQHCCLAGRRSWIRIPALGFSAWSLHVLPLHVWALFENSGFIPQCKNMTDGLIVLCQLPLGMSICIHGCLPCVSPCCPVTGSLSRVCHPMAHVDRHQPGHILTRKSRYRRWMDGSSCEILVVLDETKSDTKTAVKNPTGS